MNPDSVTVPYSHCPKTLLKNNHNMPIPFYIMRENKCMATLRHISQTFWHSDCLIYLYHDSFRLSQDEWEKPVAEWGIAIS